MTEESISQWLATLPNRTKPNASVMHVMFKGGIFTCLDLNLVADSTDDLDLKIAAWFASATEGEVLPSASEDKWREFAELHPFRNNRVRVAWKRYKLEMPGNRVTVVILR